MIEAFWGPQSEPRRFCESPRWDGVAGELRESIVGEGRVLRKITGVRLPGVGGQAARRTESGGKWEAAGWAAPLPAEGASGGLPGRGAHWVLRIRPWEVSRLPSAKEGCSLQTVGSRCCIFTYLFIHQASHLIPKYFKCSNYRVWVPLIHWYFPRLVEPLPLC